AAGRASEDGTLLLNVRAALLLDAHHAGRARVRPPEGPHRGSRAGGRPGREGEGVSRERRPHLPEGVRRGPALPALTPQPPAPNVGSGGLGGEGLWSG